MPLPLADYLVNLVKLTDELPAEIVLILRIPVLTLFRRWGKYQHNPLFAYRMSGKLSTVAVEVQLHFIPHPHRWQPLTEVMHHNEVCPEILRDVVRHGRATDANLMMLRAYALAKNNQLGERFFTYSQQRGVKSLLPNGDGQQTLILPAVEIQRYAASKGADDYRLVHYLLVRDLKTFARSVIKCYDVESGTLPRHYQEALVLYHHRFSDPAVNYENAVLDADYEDMQKLMHQYTDPKMRAAKVRDVYGNTYWYYYFFVK